MAYITGLKLYPESSGNYIMDNSLLAVRDINHKYIVVESRIQIKK